MSSVSFCHSEETNSERGGAGSLNTQTGAATRPHPGPAYSAEETGQTKKNERGGGCRTAGTRLRPRALPPTSPPGVAVSEPLSTQV